MLNPYICPHSFTPLASKAQIPQRCGRDYTKETGVSRQHSAARHTVMAANRKTRHNNTMTSRQYGRRAIYVPRDVRFQDGDTVDLKNWGGVLFLPSFPSFFQCFICASLFRNKVHTQDYSCIMVHRPVRHSGTFCERCKSMCMCITPIGFNNVRLSPLIVMPNVSGLLRPRVLKPLHFQRLS